MKKIIDINLPNENQGYFPMYAHVVSVPDRVRIDFDPVWCINIPHQDDWHICSERVEYDQENNACIMITIDRYDPEWVELGKRHVIANGGDPFGVDYNHFSPDEWAALYIHQKLLTAFDAVAIFSWRW